VKRIIKRILDLIRNTSATQLVEEGLLLVIALFMLTVMLGLVHNVINMVTSFFGQTWKEIQEIAQGLFSWMWTG